jgi:hypothetical protein
MRVPSAGIFAFFIAAVATQAAPARAADALTGNMQPFSYLLGAPWNCSTNVPAMGGMPAHTDQGTATFNVAPGNVAHNHVSTPTYSGDFYFGYNTRMNSFWQTSADSMGGSGFLTSSDGKSYTGTSSMGPLSSPETVTYAKLSDNKVTVHDVISGSMPATIDSVCTR